MTAPWIQTFTGAKHLLLTPDYRDVRLADIAHALGLICRFTGHVREHYSVAQHSVNVARLLRDQGHTAGVQAQGLLHDAHEAYTGDVASPIKVALRAMGSDPLGEGLEDPWFAFEELHEQAVRRRFGLPLGELSPAVKAADTSMLLAEHRDLMNPCPHDWEIPGHPAPFRVYAWPAAQATREFLDWGDRLDIR